MICVSNGISHGYLVGYIMQCECPWNCHDCAYHHWIFFRDIMGVQLTIPMSCCYIHAELIGMLIGYIYNYQRLRVG